MKDPPFFARFPRLPPRLLYDLGLGPIIGRVVLLLTTVETNTGFPLITPLPYREINGVFYVAAANGWKAAWVRNLLANPQVEARVKRRRFQGLTRPITDPGRIVAFLELQGERRPSFLEAVLRVEQFPAPPDRNRLEQYAARLALIAIWPHPP